MGETGRDLKGGLRGEGLRRGGGAHRSPRRGIVVGGSMGFLGGDTTSPSSKSGSGSTSGAMSVGKSILRTGTDDEP